MVPFSPYVPSTWLVKGKGVSDMYMHFKWSLLEIPSLSFIFRTYFLAGELSPCKCNR